mmetsp:Transcript_54502/g.127151  ORF Transcript_54502/g.127151 Transcript_54502/m.127151 type:complete len:121 (+) Transcript_54502:181-543(+)
MLPEFEPTGPKTVVRSLALLMNRWNLEYPSGICCKYHAVASLMVYLLRCEMSQKCKTSWAPNSSGQCPSCGLMHLKEECVCNFCGWAHDATSPDEGLTKPDEADLLGQDVSLVEKVTCSL